VSRKLALLVFIFAFAATLAFAESDTVCFPSASYTPVVPTLEAALGYKLGDAFTSYASLEHYYQTLAQASDRVKLESYGKSVEGRTLYTVIISTPKNLARLDAIRSAAVRLSDPRTLSDGEAQKLIADTPVTVWLMYNVHGNESASSEAAMQVAYELSASQDARVLEWLDKAIVVIDPIANPDGRERYVQFYRERMGSRPRADRFAAEHQERWPGGRANHYLFDLNRDWAWQTQPESAARVKVFRRWYPQVFVDFHEMGPSSTYFFPPPAKPVLEYVQPLLGKWYELYGRANATAFDKHGFRYFTRDTFDFFYPAYGDSWPSLNGAVGMTYEQGGGGVSGLVIDLPDDQRTLTLHERAAHHFVSSLATIEASVQNREARLRDYYEFRRAAIRAGEQTSPRQYYLVPSRNRDRVAHVVEVLLRQGIEVRRADSDFDAEDLSDYWGQKIAKKRLPAGTYVVDLAQPAGFLARTLLEREIKHDTVFFYDVSAWSLPLAADVEAYTAARPARMDSKAINVAPLVSGGIQGAQQPTAYIVPAEEDSGMRLLGHLLQENIRAYVAIKSFKVGGREFQAGSIVVPTESNPATLADRLQTLATADHCEVFAASTLLSEDGLDLGSDRVRFLRKPRVAVLTETPVSSTDYGALWYLFEQRVDLPFTPVTVENLRSVDLSNYNVLILPPDRGEGRGYVRYLDKALVARLSEWVRDGGVIIAMRGGAVFATKPRSGLTSLTYKFVRPEDEEARVEEEKSAAAASKPEDRPASASSEKPTPSSPAEQEKQKQVQLERKLMRYADREKKQNEEEIPGAILRAILDNTHPLGFGMREQVPVINETSPIFELTAKGENIAYYPKENIKLSGFLTPENEKKLAQTAYLVRERQGRGFVILFAENPAFRGFWDGTTRLLMNAIYFGNVVDPRVR
jgi:hypothetical protein